MATRQSNIELLRLIAMVMVLALHANGAAGPFVSRCEATGGSAGFIRLFLETACVISVNAFIMISGWFGIRASFKGLASLFFQLCFYSLCIALVYKVFIGTPFSWKDVALSCLGIPYWFIPAYLILYLLSPFLNAFMDKAGQKELLISVVAFFIAELVYGRFGDQGHFHAGYSALSFIGLYLAAGYLRRHPCRISTLPAWGLFLLYGLCTLAATGIGYFIGGAMLGGNHSVLDYNHPVMVLSSVFFFLAFTRLDFQSKAVNWMAASAFAIYLIHMNFLVKQDYRALMGHLYQAFSPAAALWVMLGAVLLIALACILVDKLRILLWKPAWKRVERWTSR